MILVTGATGRTGSALVNALVTQGEQVRAMVRRPEDAVTIRELGVEVVVGDYEKKESIEASLQEVDKAFLVSPEGPQMAELQGDFVKAAKRSDVRHVVRVSILVAMKPDSPLALAQWHIEADRLVAESGIPYTILQPGYYMQNILTSAPAVSMSGVLYGAMGEGKVGVIDTRDIAEVAAEVLTSHGHEGKRYVLTGPDSLSMSDIAGRLSGILGKDVTYTDMPPADAKGGMVAMGMPEVIADAWVQLAQMVSMGAADMVTPMVEQITGKSPRTFDQFVKDHADAFKGESVAAPGRN